MDKLVEYEISIASLNARIEALKKSLNSGQKIIFDEAIKNLREEFISKHPDLTEDQLKSVASKFR